MTKHTKNVTKYIIYYLPELISFISLPFSSKTIGEYVKIRKQTNEWSQFDNIKQWLSCRML